MIGECEGRVWGGGEEGRRAVLCLTLRARLQVGQFGSPSQINAKKG